MLVLYRRFLNSNDLPENGENHHDVLKMGTSRGHEVMNLFGGDQTIQTYGYFEGFPPIIVN